MKTSFIIISTIFFLINIDALWADEIKIIGSVPYKPPTDLALKNSSAAPKTVKLMKLDISKDTKRILQNRVMQLKQTQFNNSSLPSSVILGMNGVPVLDQGFHNTCVTFAVTAAFDAALNKGDYVSQLCHLQLGTFLEKNSYSASGWEGAHGARVLNRFSEFGIVNKAYQEKNGCGGAKEYPLFTDVSAPMSLEDYHQASEDIENNKIHWRMLFNLFESEIPNIGHRQDDIEKNLQEIKFALSNKQRVVLGIFMHVDYSKPENDFGNYKTKYDTFILTQQAIDDIKEGKDNFYGHEIVLTGYDDNAIAYDALGIPHRGLFYLRNSFGTGTPGNGDQYITYDYVKILADEAYSIAVRN